MNPTCPTGCADVVASLPTVKFDDRNPEINAGEIEKIYLGVRGNPFTDWELATEWTTRLASNTATKIIALTVMGDKPAPTTTTKEISGGRKVTVSKDHVINATIDETNETNHEMIRKIECGGQFLAWYETSGGLMFGGKEGIPVSIEANMVIPKGRGENMTHELGLSWKAKFTEERIVSPIA